MTPGPWSQLMPNQRHLRGDARAWHLVKAAKIEATKLRGYGLHPYAVSPCACE
eukprot:CAMPEP_0180683046 /NCGR_PEP_ID=MMETSP1037_2-20121125/70924_1 /TAXON_ID=632150 /ORGANISM="Azadinium spinosum, Strain 3D9" /LENGTH=52 /DNA_ID=CAMNT_0022713165 /DNA_START=31 /DNA_END=186 /DNA_ORIENTATION=+